MIASFLDYKFTAALCLIALSRCIWPQRYYAIFGAISSALVLGFAAPKSLLAIGGITIIFLLPLKVLGGLLERSRVAKTFGKSIVAAAIGTLVLVLVTFKIYRHFSVPWLGGAWLREDILGVIGFSYFIFRAIDYLRMQSILGPNLGSPWELLFYVLFPPTITSGPIQKYRDFLGQCSSPLPLSTSNILSAIYRVTRGYFRKTVIAVIINGILEKLLATPHIAGYESLLILFFLYLYFYYDFAGYSDISIGFGIVIGIRVPENFRKPFGATSVSEFWRNWHITLVDWFRDHIFIPFGGMRGSRLYAASLAFSIMVLCGLWHGLALNFIFWGFWHGTNIFTEAIFGIKPIPPGLRRGSKYWLRVLWTNARVAAGCIFFLPDSEAIFRVITGLATWRVF